jgi:alkanesulfonate monooxygenase SsuD/methylene tetrahydromethanopterin reductase-like flavin-dependent oxidoreductase (luciferase family)
VRRTARIGDGWIPFFGPDERGRTAVAKLHDYAREAGRDPADIGIERMLLLRDTPGEKSVEVAAAFAEMGVPTLSLNTMNAGLDSPSAHMKAMRLFKEAVAGM